MTFDMNEVHELELKRPNKTKEWRDKGHEILDEKYRSDWDNVVPIRLDDLYEGMELKACLDIIEELNIQSASSWKGNIFFCSPLFTEYHIFKVCSAV